MYQKFVVDHTEKVVLLTTVLVIASLFDGALGAITATGNATQNGTRGENISIIWKVNGLTPVILQINVNIIATENEIFGMSLNPVTESGNLPAKGRKEIEKRSSGAYNYLGQVAGSETGEIVLHITNLTLKDEIVFILANGLTEIAGTNVYVEFPGVKCGAVLKEEYTVKQGEQHQATSGFCGKPQPTVTCSLNGVDYGNPSIVEVSEHNYNYTITLPKNLKPCTMKDIVCVVTSYDKSFFQETITARGEFSSSIKANSFCRHIEFTRKCTDCSLISWKKNIETGECNVRYQLSFLNGTNITSAPVVLNKNSYSKCSIQAQSIKVATYIYGTTNGVYKLLGNDTSDPVKRAHISCPTTIATTATTTKSSTSTGCFSLKEEQEENQRQLHERTIIIIVMAVITSISVVLNITILISVKTGKIKYELVRKQKEKDKAEPQELQLKETVAIKQQSDYMELQASRKDITYQDLTTVRDNSTYEIYYKDI